MTMPDVHVGESCKTVVDERAVLRTAAPGFQKLKCGIPNFVVLNKIVFSGTSEAEGDLMKVDKIINGRDRVDKGYPPHLPGWKYQRREGIALR